MSAQPVASISVAGMASALFEAGVLSFPAKIDGKHPYVLWGANRFADGWPDRKQHTGMFLSGAAQRLFVVCGKRSDGVTCIDFDQPTYFEQWAAKIFPEILDKLYIEQSQRSGGYHVAFKVKGGTPSLVPARDARAADGKIGAVRIEVRGEGNGFVAAPSPGYQWIQGDLTDLPVLAPQEYARLMYCAEAFNECEIEQEPERIKKVRPATDDELPGTRFNRENAQREVAALFERHGYSIGRRDAHGNVPITRPGATSETSGNISVSGVLHMFSTNTPFVPSSAGKGNPYTPFAVFTWLEHGGDYAAAGKALHRLYNPPAIRVIHHNDNIHQSDNATPLDTPHPVNDLAVEEEIAAIEAGERRYRLYTATEIKERPAVTFRVEGLIPEGALCALIGNPGTYKTFVVLDIALCIATGTPWHGKDVEQGRVVFISAEGAAGLGQRITAWERKHWVTVDDEHFRVITDAPQLLDGADVHTLIASIQEAMEAPHGIFIDTLARTFDGEENSSQDMGAYIRSLDRVRNTFGAFVCPIHHLNKAGVSARGSSAFFAALDVEMTMTKETDAVSLAITKAKEFGEGAPIVFTPEKVEVAKHVTSLVLVTGDLKVSTPSADERRALSVLVDVFGSEGVTQSRWEKAAIEAGLTDTRFARARRVLVERGWVNGPPRGAYVRGFRYVATDEGVKVFEGVTKVSEPSAHEGVKVSLPLSSDTLTPSSVRDAADENISPSQEEETDDLF